MLVNNEVNERECEIQFSSESDNDILSNQGSTQALLSPRGILSKKMLPKQPEYQPTQQIKKANKIQQKQIEPEIDSISSGTYIDEFEETENMNYVQAKKDLESVDFTQQTFGNNIKVEKVSNMNDFYESPRQNEKIRVQDSPEISPEKDIGIKTSQEQNFSFSDQTNN